MIVSRRGSAARCFTQADHARLAAEFLSLFRLSELAVHPRRAEILRAVREHDNGWWEADAAPRRSPDSLSALDFRQAAGEMRREIWGRGCSRYASEEPYLAALVARHVLRLVALQEPAEAWERFRSELEGDVAGWLAAAGRSEDEASRDDVWTRLGDGLSLVACTGDTALSSVPGWEVTYDERPAGDEVTLGLAPFPLAGSTRFEIPFRVLPVTAYPSDTTLSVALATAGWQSLVVRLVPLSAV